MADVTADDFTDRENAAKARLRFICGEIIQRIHEASDSDGIGDFLQLAREAAHLALELGFARPPYQHLDYSRDADPNAPDPKTAENYVGGFVAVPHIAGIIKHQHPDWIYACGFRVFDPVELTSTSDLMLHALSDADIPDRPRLFPVNVAGDKIVDYRRRVERTMERWIRIIEMPPRPTPSRIEFLRDRQRAATAMDVNDPVTVSDLSQINRKPKPTTIQNKIRQLKGTALAFPLPVISKPGMAQIWSYAVIRPCMKREWSAMDWPESYETVRQIIRNSEPDA